MDLCDLSVARAAELVRRREIAPIDLVRAALARIEALEPTIRAWQRVDGEGALAAARRLEREPSPNQAGPLRGVPVGIKDILFTAGLTTTNGSPAFADFVPASDATAVARLRAAGAIILGKTVTVQWAFADPPVTRNPWNPGRTPGGSSSGSAAAVAAGMVPAALGTQTGGSILRPAAFCGVVGLKPTYGRVSRHGVTPASWSLDHVGPLTRSVEDAALLLQAIAGWDRADLASANSPVADYVAAARRTDRPPSLGLVSDYLEAASPEVAAQIQQAASRLERNGATVRELRLPRPLPLLIATRQIISQVESAGLHARALRQRPEAYAPRISAQIRVGQLVPAEAYIQAQRLRRQIRPQVEAMLDGVDCLLLPTVENVAQDPSSTGQSGFQAVWSLFGLPSISLPSGLSADRLPIGLQLVARPFREDTLLSAAAWCEARLDPLPRPEPAGIG
jgi:aspartyl-tRNA(Asn)/glutamyl-tRNA(Gln) amidotransferase subunit A